MKPANVEQIADAVLYEGYILYPYRASALKNRKRFNFGVVYPRDYAQAQEGTVSNLMKTECLVMGNPNARIEINVRFLQLISRVAGYLDAPLSDWREGRPPGFRPADAVQVQGKIHSTWQEAVEREVPLPSRPLREILASPTSEDFRFPGDETFEPLRGSDGSISAGFSRKQESLLGRIDVHATPLAGTGPTEARGGEEIACRLRVQILNLTTEGRADDLDDVMVRSLVSAHTVLRVRGGRFISLLDPPPGLKREAAACENLGAYPVLAGEAGTAETMLSSPIILYDYPQVAEESPGSFFDGTEIDEMLALRILTLTDEEKREMGQVDERARELLERTETLPPEHLMKLHGVLRSVRPAP